MAICGNDWLQLTWRRITWGRKWRGIYLGLATIEKYNRIEKLCMSGIGNRWKWREEPWRDRLSGSFWRRRWRDLQPRTCRENCHEPLRRNGGGRRWERGLTESCGEERRHALSGIWSTVKCSYSPPWICTCETNLDLTLYPLLVFSILSSSFCYAWWWITIPKTQSSSLLFHFLHSLGFRIWTLQFGPTAPGPGNILCTSLFSSYTASFFPIPLLLFVIYFSSLYHLYDIKFRIRRSTTWLIWYVKYNNY